MGVYRERPTFWQYEQAERSTVWETQRKETILENKVEDNFYFCPSSLEKVPSRILLGSESFKIFDL